MMLDLTKLNENSRECLQEALEQAEAAARTIKENRAYFNGSEYSIWATRARVLRNLILSYEQGTYPRGARPVVDVVESL